MLIKKIEQNLIKINFKYKEKSIYLGDLLKFSSGVSDGVIAQVIKIENEPEDQDFYTATAKMLFTIENTGKISRWKGNVPGSDFSVDVLGANEIAQITNTATPSNPISLGELSIEASLLEAPSIIVGDKETDKNNLLRLLASELSGNNSNVVIVDIDGEFSDLEQAKVLVAGKDIKLPLDLVGLENLYNKTLSQASVEVRANIENIFSEIEEYLCSGDVSFIPFSAFLNAVKEEYKANDIPELSLLVNSLVKLHKHGIFADSQDEIDALFDSLDDNNLIVLDLSDISDLWKSEFIDNIVRSNTNSFFMAMDIDQFNEPQELAKTVLNQKLRGGIKPILTLGHESEVINAVSSKVQNIFMLAAHNGTKLPGFEYFLPRLEGSEVLICGKVTNNVPIYAKIAELEGIEPEITISMPEPVIEEPEIEEEEVIEQLEEPESIIQEEVVEEVMPEPEESEREEDSEPDDNFDYTSSEEFQDDSILDYIGEDEPEESIIEEPAEEIVEEVAEIDMAPVRHAAPVMQEVIERPKPAPKLKMPAPPAPNLPVYNVPEDNAVKSDIPELDEGDTVRHKKYGTGVIKKVIGYSEKRLYSIHFDDVGRRLLDPKLAELEKVL